MIPREVRKQEPRVSAMGCSTCVALRGGHPASVGVSDHRQSQSKDAGFGDRLPELGDELFWFPWVGSALVGSSPFGRLARWSRQHAVSPKLSKQGQYLRRCNLGWPCNVEFAGSVGAPVCADNHRNHTASWGWGFSVAKEQWGGVGGKLRHLHRPTEVT